MSRRFKARRRPRSRPTIRRRWRNMGGTVGTGYRNTIVASGFLEEALGGGKRILYVNRKRGLKVLVTYGFIKNWTKSPINIAKRLLGFGHDTAYIRMKASSPELATKIARVAEFLLDATEDNGRLLREGNTITVFFTLKKPLHTLSREARQKIEAELRKIARTIIENL